MNSQGNSENTPDISGKSASGSRWDFSVNRRFIQRSVITVLALVIAFQLVEWAFAKSKDFLFLLLLAWCKDPPTIIQGAGLGPWLGKTLS